MISLSEALRVATRELTSYLEDSDLLLTVTRSGFPAQAGWDGATGWGTPDFVKIKNIALGQGGGYGGK